MLCGSVLWLWMHGVKGVQNCRKKSFTSDTTFFHVVEDIFLKCEVDEVKQFVGIVRRLWLWRNEVVHGGRMTHPTDLVLQTKMAIEEFAEVIERGGEHIVSVSGGNIERNFKWLPPDTGWIKANWDASLAKNKGGWVSASWCVMNGGGF